VHDVQPWQPAREETIGPMFGDLLGQGIDGSAASLVGRLLDESSPSPQELEEIHETIEQFRRGGEGTNMVVRRSARPRLANDDAEGGTRGRRRWRALPCGTRLNGGGETEAGRLDW
jgi:hypothetical protein